MRHFVMIILACLLIVSIFGKSLQISSRNTSELNISFKLPSYSKDRVFADGKISDKLKVTSTDEETWNENMSGLPQLEQWVYIPDGYDARVTINNSEIIQHNNYDCSKTDDPADDNNWFDVSEPVIFRGNKIFSICIKPFQYNIQSKQLTTLNSSEIRVEFIQSNSNKPNHKLQSRTTTNMLKSLCINRDDIRNLSELPGSYVILYNTAQVLNLIQPFVDWKCEKGYEVHLLNTGTIGNSTTAIKSYLQNAYDTWINPPEFIMIFGSAISSSANSVPTYTESYEYTTVGDYKYTLLDGTDIVPDAYIGRITFSSNDELTTAVNRMISYEKLQGLATANWMNKSFLLADTSNSGASCLTTISYIKNLIQSYNTTTLFIEAYSGSFPSQINAALNSGVGTYWYRGHGDFSGWTTTNINNLSNTGKYPFFSYITCFTGNFGSTAVSQAERLIRLGTPSIPRGAIAVVGASCETHTCLNNITTAGIAYGLYADGLSQSGPAMVRGKLALMANYPQNPSNYINQYMQSINLFGDPALDIWLKQVDDIIVTSPTQLSGSPGSIAIRVTHTNNTPIEGALVCLRKSDDSITISGYTDSFGWLVLNHDSLSIGIAKLTITKPNFRTYQTNMNIIDNINTVSLLNIDALQNCYAGSTINFPVTITNNSGIQLTGVSGNLESLTENVIVTQSSVNFPDVTLGVPTTSLSNFTIHINSETAKGAFLNFRLNLNYTEGNYTIPFSRQENGINIELNPNINNNPLNYGLNNLDINLLNINSIQIDSLNAILDSSHPLVIIQNPSQNVNYVNPGSWFNFPASFAIDVSNSLLEGIIVRFKLQLFDSNGYVQSLYFDKRIGTPTVNDITGPDSYGYICYGPGDSGYIPYNWIELDPALGGSGTAINLTDTNTEGGGVFSTVAIPFQLRFYGRIYNQLTICSNGFIMPGNQGSIEWMNWKIPGPMVPRPIIAPFWDDLLTDSSSRILYKYDNNLNALIIQWQNLKNKFSPNLRETFQVVLYDPVFNASPTGDSPILFQYKLFNNVDSGNYGLDYIDHGQYASVGIADHTGEIGIGYTFNNQYPVTAQAISNQTTLYFTTLSTYQSTAELVILNNNTTEISGNSNGMTDAGELVEISFLIKNIGLGAVPESGVVLSTSDPYVTVLQNQGTIESLGSSEMAMTSPAFQIQIAQSCPNQHLVHFTVTVQNSLSDYVLDYEMHINALQFTCSEIEYLDGNNNFPEPGETGTLNFTINNVSMLYAQNLAVSIDAPSNFIILPASQIINIAEFASQQMNYQISIPADVLQGSSIILGIHLFLASVYEDTLSSTLLVGVPEVFLNTDFEITDISQIFQTLYNVTLQPAQYIHSMGTETVFNFSAVNPWSYAFGYPISTTDLLMAKVRFTWFSSNSTANFSLSALYPNQTVLSTLWTSSGLTTTPQTETVNITGFPSEATYIILVFIANNSADTQGSIALDDLSVLTLHHAPGFISGHVNLDMYQENVNLVNIRNRFSNEVYNPDENGNYLIPAYHGLNIISAELEGYICSVDSLAVDVIGGQTSSGNDFFLQRLCAPINLTYSIQENILTLNWDVEGATERYLVPDYYKIWIRMNSFNFQDTSPEQTYSRVLQVNGNYQIFVCSVFLVNGFEEAFSIPSNTLVFNFTPNQDEIEIPKVLTLDQNHPNPFNPKTRISFALPAKSDVSLTIYNLKGQVVKNLINSELDSGYHHADWNGKDNNNVLAASGIYYYRIRWKGKEITRKMILLK